MLHVEKLLLDCQPELDLIGGFAMRYVVIYAGQMAQFISS
jgi:formate-dependent nitrite reductase membrane component NrfD